MIQKLNTRIRLYAIITTILLSFSSMAQNPWNGKLVLQGFWWDYHNNNYPNGWANYLADLAPRLKDLGVDAVWIPPCIKNGSPGNGYGPFDYYDLGDKYQKGNVKTRLGDKDELLRLIGVLHANGIEVIQDIVLNHHSDAGSADGSGGQDFNATAQATNSGYKNFRFVSYVKPAINESSTDYLSRDGRWPKNWQNFYPNQFNAANTNDWNTILFGPDVSYESNAYGSSSNASYNPTQTADYMRNGARNWLVWFKKQTGSDGFRFDAAKHYPTWALQDFIYNLKYNAGWASGGSNLFAVGENINNASALDTWINDVKTSNGGTEDLVGTFDFALREGIKSMVDGNGAFDLGTIPSYQQSNRFRTVPFVNNHDTYRPIKDANGNYTGWDSGHEIGGHIDAFDVRLSAAYAIAFAVDGSPQIFFEDLFNIGGTGKRYTHQPTSNTDLPLRDDIANLMWCHQQLNFKKGSYKVRWQAQDLLVIERGYNTGPENSYAIIGVNDQYATWQTATIQTDFGPNVQLHDYSGANSNDVWTNGSGQVTISVPPCDGSNLRKGYCVFGPVGIGGNFNPIQRSTTQEWEMANDLGDSNPLSLMEGGALPANSIMMRNVGKVFDEAGKPITVEVIPTNNTQNITVSLYDNTNVLLTSTSGAGVLTLTYTPNANGFYGIKINNTVNTNASQSVFVKATYTSPRIANTAMYPSLATITSVNNTTPENLNAVIFPNPSSNDVFLNYSLQQKTTLKITLFNVVGEQVKIIQENVKEQGVYQQKMDVSDLAQGTYFLQLQTNTETKQFKLMIVK